MVNSSRNSFTNAAPKATRSSPRLVRGRRVTPSSATDSSMSIVIDTRMEEAKRQPETDSLTSESTSLDASKVQNFMKMTQRAMEMLMREHGFSPLRAQRTLLDYLVLFHGANSYPLSDAEVRRSLQLVLCLASNFSLHLVFLVFCRFLTLCDCTVLEWSKPPLL
jgi:hypothetical protein